jgi:hypothetical protein
MEMSSDVGKVWFGRHGNKREWWHDGCGTRVSCRGTEEGFVGLWSSDLMTSCLSIMSRLGLA